MLSWRCQLDTHIIYKSLQSRLHGWDRNTLQEITGITLVFKAMEVDELLGKEEKRLHASSGGEVSKGQRVKPSRTL